MDPEGTLRSRMGPGVFFNQSEFARQPSDAYDPARRQVNRGSELSSLSSGFGDGGDMVLPDGAAVLLGPPPPAAANPRQSRHLTERSSWMRSVAGAGGGRRDSRGSGAGRDTVYTQASEDAVPRFRTVSSWVNQQTGRIRRA